ncbi:protein LURP-one-related 1-like [Ananas comosus]|uniref:Protein LURP-one-related 1-like n=1 Tax=Ananas comosus TaxID=4615 RepID=A0A6P5FXM8_ANACO|nr:protein LURP-one-related 1-like [Ananas comosus]
MCPAFPPSTPHLIYSAADRSPHCDHREYVRPTCPAIGLTDGDFAVTNANSAMLLKVKCVFFALHEDRILVDTAGNSLLSIQAKILTCMARSMESV